MYLIRYPDCKGEGLKQRAGNLLHLWIMAWTVQTTWAVFLSNLFECLDFNPLPALVQAFLPQDFHYAGYGETRTTTLIISLSAHKKTTGKISVSNYPHSAFLHCSDTSSDTISDKDITDQCQVLNKINKGFDIAALCLKKEDSSQLPTFKIDWTILNASWPINRIDLLGYCFKIFVHIVNILKTPVGPKESG
ncbi:hypothetical protein pdam_00025345, partial [Pocillopora damicornis]